MIEINKLKKLKKGNRILLNGEEYEVKDFDVDIKKEGDDFLESKEIILNKVKEKPKVLLKQKYILRYNEKKREFKFFKLIEKSVVDSFPKDFPIKNRSVVSTNYEEIFIRK